MLKIRLLSLLIIGFVGVQAQTKSYKFKREITGVQSVWHTMKLPDDLYKHQSADFADLRIFGIKGKDTTEVPYILKQGKDKITNKSIDFKQINQSENSTGYFYTFQLKEASIINQIDLDFNQINFDWRVMLEGSNDNTNWFSILKNYRILGIKNNDTDYKFSKLSFPDSKYQYFRIAIKSDLKPENLEAKISKMDTVSGNAEKINYTSYNLFNDVAAQRSSIEIALKNASPISSLKLNVESDFDFYRNIKIRYATESFESEKGTQYNFMPLYEGTLSSLEKTQFNFPNTIVKFLRIDIQNNDNKPLRFKGVELFGSSYEIIARFDDLDSKYALYYDNPNADNPNYEITNFENKIPSNLTQINIGKEEKNPSYSIVIEKPLFENKSWLWALMGIIIFVLGWFSFKMLRD
ncbi:DUF3999 domain-containing protein [Pedobacter changchengzhani]|uniref:DUF3999 domain-containing protein n=1 Tax=Pedobacter changchengzhani TaxID=2529274 RepID=A0A4V3A0A4_9SPHI|nr:DUF3999 domain-containing protein [Pedobacter changchengzhani]TDG36843.1 DUF3999 domain-containing protein [Pedobacter changchengzhani]